MASTEPLSIPSSCWMLVLQLNEPSNKKKHTSQSKDMGNSQPGKRRRLVKLHARTENASATGIVILSYKYLLSLHKKH